MDRLEMSMEFRESIQVCFRKYTVFSGKATRSEFWWFMLFCFVCELTLYMIGIFFVSEDFGAFLMVVVRIALFLPQLAVSSRRLHDIGFSAWWLLLHFILVIGQIILIILHCLPSKDIVVDIVGHSPDTEK